LSHCGLTADFKKGSKLGVAAVAPDGKRSDIYFWNLITVRTGVPKPGLRRQAIGVRLKRRIFRAKLICGAVSCGQTRAAGL